MKDTWSKQHQLLLSGMPEIRQREASACSFLRQQTTEMFHFKGTQRWVRMLTLLEGS